MNKRLWGLVALFAGIVGMLGVWLMMSEDPATPEAEARSEVASARPKPGEPPDLKRTQALRVSPERAHIGVRDVAMRQQRLIKAREGLPSLPLATPEGVFELDQAGIAAAVDERKADLKACYETALFHTPGLSGKMTLALQIEPAPGKDWGTVASVDSDSTLDATVLEGCVTTVFEELRFDAREPVTIRYPISFTE